GSGHWDLPHDAPNRPCLDYHVERCRAPCVGYQSEADYRRMIDDVLLFLEGKTVDVRTRLRERMHEASQRLDYERAAQLRDALKWLDQLEQPQTVELVGGGDADAIGLARDGDYLGWRYSLISSIAIAGWNNVIDMIPARDSSEHAYFSAADQAWFRHWIAWADTNREYLRHSRPILGQPAIGKIDGTAAMLGDHGFVFLFNPNARRLTATLTRQELGLAAGSFWLRELGEEGLGARVWGLGDTISISVEGESYRVLAIAPVGRGVAAPPAPLAAVSFNRQIGVVDSSFTGGSFAATFS